MNKKLLFVLAFIGAGWGNYSNAQYCENGPTDALESNIEAVSLNGVNATSLTYTGCPGVVGVEDETTQIVELVAGQEYTLDVTFGTCGGDFAGAGEAWIDFNQDDVFDAATESIGNSSGTPGTAPWDAPVTFTFTVPSTATTGATRIRVMQEEGGTTPLDPCASYTFGSVVDFTVDILAQPATPPTPDQDPGTPSCSTGSDLTLAGTPPAGIDWYWQGTNSNGTSTADDGTAPYTVFGNGTYYARAYDPALDAWSEEFSITISNFVTPGTPQYIEEEYFACVGDPSIEIEVEDPLGSSSLFTTNAGGNGCGGGAMFDLTTNTDEITVTSLDILPNTTATQNVSVYIKTTGGYNGSQTVPGDWTLIGTYSVNTTNGVPINVDVADFVIPSSTTYGVYVEYGSSYTNNATGTTYTNAELTLTVGDGLCSAFGGVNTGRAFNGTIFYDITTATPIDWFDAASSTTGNLVGSGNILETVGTSVMPTATAGTYDFYAFSVLNDCYSNSGLHVEVHVAPVNVEVTGIDATCNGSETGTFDITDTLCGVTPFTYSVDGGAFGSIPTDLLPGSHTVIVQDDNGDESGEYTFTVGEADEPSDLVVINIVSDGGQVSWNANGNETEWNVEWGLPGFSPGTGNEIGSSVVTDTFDIITGLNPNTEYDIYVSANCGVGSVTGDWGAVSFITDCGIEVTPFYENFDGSNWVSGTGFNNTGDAISPCWTRSAGTFFFGTRTGTTSNAATGPLDDFTGGGNYIYTEGSVGTNGDLATITTPEIDLTYLTDPYLTFYYHMYGADITSLEVEVTNDGGITWTTEASIVGQQQSSNADIWIDRGVNLATYIGDTIQVRFSTVKAGFNADLAIDEIEIKEAPTCPKPTDFMTGTVLDVSVELEWVNGGSETMWNIEYGPAGFTQGTGTTVASTTNPETITGLNPETGYHFYIQADCGGGDESDWVGPINVVTECAAFVAPFLESFDIGSLPNCWSNTSSNTTSANTLWKFGTGVTGGATSNGRPAGTYAWSDGSTPVVDDVTLISPLIDLSALTVPTLSFDWFSNNTTSPGDNVPLYVDINDGSGWTNLFALAGDDPNWQKEEVTLAAYIGQTVQFRFITDQTATSGSAFNNDILLDSVSVDEGPSCPKPTPINVTNIAATSVDLDWLAGYLET
ncbi:MAG: GEVED domain-containing protein, partial [Brumimicrobium sp.]